MLPIAIPGGQVVLAESVRSVRPLSTVKILPASLVCLWLLLGVGSLEAQSDNKENNLQHSVKSAREVLHRVRDSFIRIKTIHYTFETNRSKFSTGKPTRTTQTDGEFAFDNGKFYSWFDVDTTASERGKLSARTAFDGSVHQRYEDDRLIVSSQMPEQPYTALQPVIFPFMFAHTRTGRLTFEEISNQESWDEIANGAIVEPSEIVNGHPCDVVSFTKQSGASTIGQASWKVYAARDLGYYPVRVTVVGGKVYSVSDVTELKVVPSAMGDVVIPIKIVSESREEGGRPVQSKSYAVSLKSVNVDLDDSLFSLKRFEPRITKYVDTAPNLASEGGSWLNLLIAFNVCVVVLLLIAVLIKRRKSNPKAGPVQ